MYVTNNYIFGEIIVTYVIIIISIKRIDNFRYGSLINHGSDWMLKIYNN